MDREKTKSPGKCPYSMFLSIDVPITGSDPHGPLRTLPKVPGTRRRRTPHTAHHYRSPVAARPVDVHRAGGGKVAGRTAPPSGAGTALKPAYGITETPWDHGNVADEPRADTVVAPGQTVPVERSDNGPSQLVSRGDRAEDTSSSGRCLAGSVVGLKGNRSARMRS